MPDSPDTQNRLYAVQEDTRRELAAEFSLTDRRPQGLILPNVDVRSETFERVLPKLLAASQKARLNDLGVAVGSLTESTNRLLRATEEGGRTSSRLYRVTWLLLAVALATLAVALLQVVR